MKQFIKTIPAIFMTAALMFALNVSAAPWSGPSQAFPLGNADSPVHTGEIFQSKASGLGSGLSGDSIFGFEADYVLGLNGLYSGQDVYAKRFCLGDLGVTDFFLSGGDCIDDWDDLMQTIAEGVADGNQDETLRWDGSDWISNNVLKNDGETVTVRRGGSAFSPELGLFGAKKAFAQNPGSTAPIFRAIKDMVNPDGSIGGHKGLEVLSSGITWTKGGFVGEGDATIIGDVMVGVQNLLNGDVITPANLYVSGESHLDRTIIGSGSNFSGYDANFQFGGNGETARFWVGTNAEFDGEVQIASGNPSEGKVLTALDSDGNTGWLNLPDAPEGFTPNTYTNVSGASGEGAGINSPYCNAGDIMVSGGGECVSSVGVLEASRPNGNRWYARCGGTSRVKSHIVCLGNSASEVYIDPNTEPAWTRINFAGSPGQSCVSAIGGGISASDIRGVQNNQPWTEPSYVPPATPPGSVVGSCPYILVTEDPSGWQEPIIDIIFAPAGSGQGAYSPWSGTWENRVYTLQ